MNIRNPTISRSPAERHTPQRGSRPPSSPSSRGPLADYQALYLCLDTENENGFRPWRAALPIQRGLLPTLQGADHIYFEYLVRIPEATARKSGYPPFPAAVGDALVIEIGCGSWSPPTTRRTRCDGMQRTPNRCAGTSTRNLPATMSDEPVREPTGPEARPETVLAMLGIAATVGAMGSPIVIGDSSDPTPNFFRAAVFATVALLAFFTLLAQVRVLAKVRLVLGIALNVGVLYSAVRWLLEHR